MTDSAPRRLEVFLCHSSGDKATVRELYRRLDSEGWINAWLDEVTLFPGHDWDYEIRRAVKAADIIIVCLTKQSVNKEGYIQRELKMVLDQADYKPEGTLFIIPVRLEEVTPPERLSRWHYADYFPEADRDRAYQRLLASLRNRAQKLGIPTDVPAKAAADVKISSKETGLPASQPASRPGPSAIPSKRASTGRLKWLIGAAVALGVLCGGILLLQSLSPRDLQRKRPPPPVLEQNWLHGRPCLAVKQLAGYQTEALP